MYQWKSELNKILNTGQTSVILLHGNVRDFFQIENEFVNLTEYLLKDVLEERQYKIFYDSQAGIQFTEQKHRQDFFQSLQGYDAYHKTNYAQSPPKEPGAAFSLIENINKLKVIDNISTVSVINYVEQIIPASNNNTSAEIRYLKIALDKWAQNPKFVDNNITFFLIVENLAKVDEFVTRNPFIPRIFIEHPDVKTRTSFVTKMKNKWDVTSDLKDETIGTLSSGLSLLQLSRMFAYIQSNKMQLDLPALKKLKKEFIEAECYGLLEFVDPKYTLENVAVHHQAKKMLRQTSTAIKEGLTKHLPMGYLIAGPVGTGKTFIVNCFAGEVGIPVVKFLNFRSQWQGQTEANLEKIINLLKAVNPVVVMIDEADAFLGSRNQSGDSGTSSRVFAKLAEFMGDTTYRGKVIWFLMTSRPDLLPIDMKRQGRAEEHIALFHAQTEADEEDLFQALLRKNKIKNKELKFAKAKDSMHTYSGADVEAIIVRAALQSELKKETTLTQETLNEIAKNFISPNYPRETELQILSAIRECTNQKLIPKKYKKKQYADVTARINELTLLLRE